jgi:hypothetical protein
VAPARVRVARGAWRCALTRVRPSLRAAQPAQQVARDGRVRRRRRLPRLLRQERRQGQGARAQRVRTRQRTGCSRAPCAALAHSRAAAPPRPRSVPNQLRGVIWQLLSGSRELRLRNADLYEQARALTAPLLSSANAPSFTHALNTYFACASPLRRSCCWARARARLRSSGMCRAPTRSTSTTRSATAWASASSSACSRRASALCFCFLSYASPMSY